MPHPPFCIYLCQSFHSSFPHPIHRNYTSVSRNLPRSPPNMSSRTDMPRPTRHHSFDIFITVTQTSFSPRALLLQFYSTQGKSLVLLNITNGLAKHLGLYVWKRAFELCLSGKFVGGLWSHHPLDLDSDCQF